MIKKLLLVEGMDRAGKDTLVDHLTGTARPLRMNNFHGSEVQKSYYDTTRLMFKDPDTSFVSRIGNAMAISEFMQMIAEMRLYNVACFAVSRSFFSTVIYDTVRGVHPEYSWNFLDDIDQIGKNAGFDFEMKLLRLFVRKDTMIERGSTEDSFEVQNYDAIEDAFMYWNGSGMFNDERTIWTDARTPYEVLEDAKSFLFT